MSIFLKSNSAINVLGDEGPFAQNIDNFSVRQSQVEMASAIEATISELSLIHI